MPAQSNASPLFQDNPVPQVDASRARPELSVVPQGVFEHTIETGESLYTIARRYDVTTDAIVQANNLSSADMIYVGQKVIIPGRGDLLAQNPASPNVAPNTQSHENNAAATLEVAEVTTPVQTSVQSPAAEPLRVATAAPVATQARDFRWPVTGRVIIDFEASRRTGINIEAPAGAAVRAAENGSVIYVGSGVEGFGNLILVRHPNGYVSAYAHLKDITVAKNDVVRRGDQIGTIGMTGSVNRPQLHFELRQGATPVDPIPLLVN
jgi:murein DD-endopeptidase MepM/ murein hydrolase activator NlpD